MQELIEAFGIDWRLLIAQAVNFGVVLVALWYFLYKPVLSMMTKRQEIVAKGVQDAVTAQEMLSGADAQVQKLVSDADRRAEEIVASARDAATAEKQRLVKEAEVRVASLTKDAQARAEEISAKALRESEQEIARLATLAAEKILRQKHD